MSQVPKDSDSPKMLSTFDRTLAQTIAIKNKHLNVNVCVNPTSQTNDLSPKQNIKGNNRVDISTDRIFE